MIFRPTVFEHENTSLRSLTGENIGPLWRRKYYVIPPQGLRNITSSIEAQNNRSVTHHSVLTIGNDITLIAKNYGGDCDWFTERSCDLPQKLWWSL